MQIVDSHCHVSLGWYEPVELLLYQMELNQVEKAVLVQLGGCFDNRYLLDCVARFPGRFAAVVAVDSSQPDAEQSLEEWTAKGAAGVRLGPKARSPGEDPMAIWRKASELRLAVSSIGSVEDFASEDFRRLVAHLPDLKICIEHLASGAKDAPAFDNYRAALQLAAYPNVTMKIGGLGEISIASRTFSDKLAFAYTPPMIEMALEAFGPQRLMWGSDYPPVSSREGYRNALQGILNYPALSNPKDREWIMGRSALQVFRFA